MKTVSLIVPTYNGGNYIELFLRSLIEQKRKPNEVIFRDDGSTDNTVSIIKQFIDIYGLTNWKIYENSKNLGWRKNFQLLLTDVKSDIIFFADQDDIWYSNKINDMVECFEKNPEIRVLSSNYDTDASHGSEVEFGNLSLESPNVLGVSKIKFSKNNFIIKRPGWTFAIDRRILPFYEEAQRECVNKSYDAIIWQIGLISGSLYHLSSITGKWIMHQDSAMSEETKQIKMKKKYVLLKYFFDEQKFAEFCLKQFSNGQFIGNERIEKFLSRRQKEFLQRYLVINNGSYIALFSGIKKYSSFKNLLSDFLMITKIK